MVTATTIKKGYKQTDVGVIPGDWDVFEFGQLVNYTKGFAFKSKDYKTDGIRIIRVSDTTFDSIKEEDEIYIDEGLSNQYRKWRIEEDDLILSTVGSKPPMYDSIVGKVIIIQKKHEGALLNQNAVLIRAKRKSKFIQQILFNHFRTKRYIRYIESIFRGNANQASITLEELFQFQIPLPKFDFEQTSIATVLSDANALISKLEELISKKRNIKQGAMQELLTGKKRLPGFSGKWEEVAIKDLCQLELGVITKGGNLNYLEIGDINIDRKTYFISDKEKLSVPGSVKVPRGTLLISTVRPTRGAITITKETICVSSAFCRLNIANMFVFYIVSYDKFLNYLGENSTGGTYPTCRKEDILDYKYLAPKSSQEQTAIAQVLSDMDAEIDDLEQKLDKYKMIKQGMMQELLTGKTRLI
jgi:type I restriction enzyme S subunit